MIVCPKCGSDNMIGAIFCRTCGEKLNLDELKPDAFDAPPEAMGAKIGRIAQRLILLVLGVGLVVLIVGMFWPAPIRYVGDLEEADMAMAQRKFQGLQNPVPRMPSRFTFTSNEATAIVNQTLGLPATGGGNRKPQLLSVEFLSSGTCALTLKSLLFGQIPMFTRVMTRPTVAAAGDVNLQILSVSIGKLPLPGGLRTFGLKQFAPLNIGTAFSGAESHIKTMTISGDSCLVTWQR